MPAPCSDMSAAAARSGGRLDDESSRRPGMVLPTAGAAVLAQPPGCLWVGLLGFAQLCLLQASQRLPSAQW